MKKKILLIEENKIIGTALVDQINWDSKLMAVHCSSIPDAMLESQKPFDMVIIEPIISGMNFLTENELREIDRNSLFTGFALLKRLRDINPKAKIILYTTLSWNSVYVWEKLFHGHLIKPDETIKSEIEKYLHL